jgi:CBS domain containing-hemolysin-like protein
MRLEDALRRMQRSGHHLAIVVGPDQRERGLVTLQDVLRTAFGEVPL